MLCNAKLRNKAAYCQKHALQGKTRCSLHGGFSLAGDQHWNYQAKGCTRAERQRSVETNAYINLLEQLAINLGMIETKR